MCVSVFCWLKGCHGGALNAILNQRRDSVCWNCRFRGCRDVERCGWRRVEVHFIKRIEIYLRICMVLERTREETQ